MNIRKIINAAVFAAALALASCGGDSGTTTTGTTTNPADVLVTVNTGTVTVTATPGDVVSIGASGTNFKTADATGKAVFTGLAAGAVDVHVFSADGYSAASYYGVNSDKVNASVGSNVSGSVVDIYVQASNAVGGVTQYYLDDGTGNLWYGNDFLGNGNITFQDWNDPAGTVLNATVYAGTGSATSTAGNTVSGKAEIVKVGTVSVTTTAVSGAPQANLTAIFSARPATPPTLVTLNSITPPTGHTVGFVDIAGISINGAVGFGNAPTLPDTIAAADVLLFILGVIGAPLLVRTQNIPDDSSFEKIHPIYRTNVALPKCGTVNFSLFTHINPTFCAIVTEKE